MVALNTPAAKSVPLSWRLGSTEFFAVPLAGPANFSIDLVTDVEFRVRNSLGGVVLDLGWANNTGVNLIQTPPTAVIEVSEATVAATFTVNQTYLYGVRVTMADGRKYEQQYGTLSVADTVYDLPGD